MHQTHHLNARLIDRTDGHHQRIDDHIAGRDAVVRGALDDFLGDRVTHVRVFGDSRFIVGDRDHGRAVLLDERQHGLQAFILAGHGIDQGLALVDGKPRRQRGDDGGIDGQRHIRDRLNQLDRACKNRRLIGQRNSRIDVQHMRAGLDLRARVRLDPGEVARRHLGGEYLAARRIDPLADDDEGSIETDDDLLGGGTDDGVGHDAVL